MPTCGQCQGQVTDEDRVCPHCGYTFVKSRWERWRTASLHSLKRHAVSKISALVGLVAVVCRALTFGLRYSSSQHMVPMLQLSGIGLGIAVVFPQRIILTNTQRGS